MAFKHGIKPIVTDGLVFYVDAANKVSYPGSGTTATDLAGTSNGTLQSTGMFQNTNNGVFDFDGATNYIDFGSNTLINTSSPFSIVGWFYLEAYDSNGFSAAYAFKTNQSNSFVFYFNNYANYSGIGFGEAAYPAGAIRCTDSITLNQWVNVVVTYNGSGITTPSNYSLYLDTTSKSLTTNSGFSGYGNLNVLGYYDSSPAGFNEYQGQMGPIQIYNKALSASEVTQNYNALKYRFE